MQQDEADKLLIAQIRRGNERAWEQLIARFEGRLLAYLNSRLFNSSQAEDLVQETFMGFLVSLPNYDEGTPLEAFLFAIAGHKLTDQLRQNGRRPKLPLLLPDSRGHLREPTGPGRRASSLVRSDEHRIAEINCLTHCLNELCEQWQSRGEWERLKCVELLWVLGWPNKRVATALKITAQVVANHKAYVITQLKRLVEENCGNLDLEDFGIMVAE